MTTTLELFWGLSSTSKKERIASSVKLVAALQHFQSQYTPKDDTSDDDHERPTTNSDSLDLLNAQDVSYSIRRLVRGLASPRESSRLGFAVALTELLSRVNTVTCSQILSLILDSSKPQGSMSGQEERDILFARLFGFTAIVQSKLLVRTVPLPTSASSRTLPSTLDSYQELVDQLLALGDKKSWLRESAWWTIGLAIDALHGSEVPWKADASNSTIDKILSRDWSPEKIALVIKLEQLYPTRDWQSLLSPMFKNSNMLSVVNMPVLARILKESSTNDTDLQESTKVGSGVWKPQLHFVWDVILDALLQGRAEKLSTPFPEFFRIVVDESLFSTTASQERKFWGFQVFQKALPRVTETTMPMLFTKNFMRTWINHLSKPDRYLHKVAVQSVNEIQTFVQKNPHLGFSLILQLTGSNGSHHFDKLTKTKTIETILTSMNSQGIKDYIDFLLNQVNQFEGIDSSDFKAVNSRRLWIIDQLATLFKNGSIPKADDWIEITLEWFVVHGLFIIRKKSTKSQHHTFHSLPDPPFSDDLRKTCRSRLLTCLAELLSQTDSSSSDPKAPIMSGPTWISKVFSMIDTLEKDTKHLSALFEVDDPVQELLKKATDTKHRLSKVSEGQDAVKGACLLLESSVLQLRCSGDQADVDIQALSDSVDGAARLVSDKQPKKARKSSIDENQDTPVDVLVDVIIGFLEQSSTFMRMTARSVFALLSETVQPSTVDLILAQLQRRDPAELLEVAGESEVGGDEGSQDESSSSSSEDDSSDEDDLEEAVDEELREKIAQALDADGMDENDSDGTDEDLMDDDQMLAIDEKLAEVFKSRVATKQSQKANAQREATHFKNRVLDLVDVFLKRQVTNPLVLRFILPLLDLVATSGPDEKQLSDKAQGILKARFAKAKSYPIGIKAVEVTSLMSELHKQASRARSSTTLGLFSSCSLFVAKVMQQSGLDDGIVEVYQESLVDFMTRKSSSFNTAFFQEFVRRLPLAGWSTRKHLISMSGKGINAYRRCQGFQILSVLITQLPSFEHDPAEVSDFMTSLEKAIVATLEERENLGMTSAQMKSLLKIAALAARQSQSLAPKAWQGETWHMLGYELASSGRYKALTSLCNRVADISSTTIAKGVKRTIDQDENDGEVKENVKRKKVAKD